MPIWLPFLRKRLDELPTASQDNRGFLITLKSSTGIADKIYWSRKKADDSYELSELTTASAGAHTHVAADVTDFSEATDDRASALIVAGNNIDVTYNDVAGTLTIDVESLTSADITDFATAVDERARDAVGTSLVAGNNIDITVSDVGNTITVDVETLTLADISDVTATFTEVNYTDGVTSAIQTQLDGKAPVAATYIVQTANGTLTAEQALGALATGIVKNTTTTGTLSIAVQGADYYAPGGTDVAITDGGTGASVAATALSNLGGQPLDATLTSLAAYNTNGLITQTAADTFAGRTLTAGSSKVSVSNGSGVAGNPTVDLGTVALNDLSDVVVASAVNGRVLASDGTDWDDRTYYTITIGPFYINDLPGTATTQAELGMFNAPTAMSKTAQDPLMARSGSIVGLILVLDAARITGTATGRVRVNGSGAAFDGGSVLIDDSPTITNSAFTTHAGGVAVSAGQTLGVEVTTSGWTPTTANVAAWVVYSCDPF